MSKRKNSANLQFAAFFFILVGAIIFLSLVLRVFFLLIESKFDGSSHFSLEVRNEKTQFLSFSPQNSTIGILTFQNIPAPFEIPKDARIKANIEINSKNLKSSLLKMMFEFPNQKEVNIIDIFRILIFSETVKDSSIAEKLVTDKTDKAEIDSIISKYFQDPKIADEKLSIGVVNATDVSGLGNKFANLLTNMGGNVVLVSTGDVKKDSTVEYSVDSYTADKIAKILKFRKVKKESMVKSLADVTVIIGGEYVY